MKLIDGYIEGDRFIMKAIGGQEVNGIYRADGLRSFARLMDDNTPTTLTIDKDNQIYIPKELNREISKQLFKIADELEGETSK